MIILDTNVVSELLRPSPEPKVEAWLAAQDGAEIYLTSISEAELRFGVAIMQEGRRRKALIDSIENILREDFRSNILSFDRSAAKAYATIAANRKRAGKPISEFDCQIAAICSVQRAAIATRNTKDIHQLPQRISIS